MHSWTGRLLAVATTAADLFAAASVSDSFHVPAVEAHAQVVKINRFHLQLNGNDKVTLLFNLSANVESLFTWNTKQVYIHLRIHYKTLMNSRNEVLLWDHVITDRDHALVQLEMKRKYSLTDQGHHLRGKKIRLVLHWHIIPKAGRIIQGKLHLSEYRLPYYYTY